ncbi:Histone H2A [Blattella germanica]|nr:Histone H2A [Blattella germanica]
MEIMHSIIWILMIPSLVLVLTMDYIKYVEYRMSDHGKGGKFKGKSKSRSSCPGLQFPVGHIHRILQKAIMPSVWELKPLSTWQLAAEVLKLSGNAARDNKKTRIIPRFLQLALRNNEELNKLLPGVTIGLVGVLPNIKEVLLPKNAEKKV